MSRVREFEAVADRRTGGGIAIRLPFDPDEAWGAKDRHHVAGSINAVPVRGALTRRDDAAYLDLGPSWSRLGVVADGDAVRVRLAPEGPQVEELGPEFRAALEADPAARRTFESLATFYRKELVRSVDGVKRPETRARNLDAAMERLRHPG
ncbi:MAG TPA: YdeI/OmpD-associated family protein [Candidatus Limnocylindrales bacterium]|nr:YdeI/OmpD-associated family protein [Candidatus Limnocylindrales bacterium]